MRLIPLRNKQTLLRLFLYSSSFLVPSYLFQSFITMSSQPGHSISPPPNPAASANSGVRRHHTISSSSRNARPASKIAINEVEDSQTDQAWNDDEVVDQDWVGGIGAVGEKSSLHRQASLPTRYHRGMFYLIPPSLFSFSHLTRPPKRLEVKPPGRDQTTPRGP